MNIQLHCASYEVKKGMYKGVEVEFSLEGLDEALEEFSQYYNSINVEEYLLADAWCDDSDTVQSIIKKCYGESLGCFIQSLRDILEENEYIEDVDHEVLEYVLGNTGIEGLRDKLEEVCIYDNIDEIYDEIVETHETETGQKLPDAVVMAFRWLGTDGKFNFMQAQGYGVFYLAGGRALLDSSY